MKVFCLVLVMALAFVGCQKDKFTSEPVIKFKSLQPNVWDASFIVGQHVTPLLTINLTDEEGDFTDSAYAYVQNLKFDSTRLDSFFFPQLSGIQTKKLNVDLQMDFSKGNLLLFPDSLVPVPASPRIDTLMYQVYIKDEAKHKSNVLTVGPVYRYVQ